MKKKTIVIVGGAIVGTVILTGCSTSASFDKMGPAYNGSQFNKSKTFDKIVQPGQHHSTSFGDKLYLYPAGMRSFDFTGGSDSEVPPISVNAKGERDPETKIATGVATVNIPGTIAFQLNPDPDTLRMFHEKIGAKYQAWIDGSDFNDVDQDKDGTPDGWEKMLSYYFGQAVKNATQTAASSFTYTELQTDTSVKLSLQTAIQKALPAELRRLTNTDKDYFTQITVNLNAPELADEALKGTITKKQQALAQADADTAQANADTKTANARVAQAEAEAKAEAARIKAFGSAEEYNKATAIEKGINPYLTTGGVALTPSK